jgi:hypothetical protein
MIWRAVPPNVFDAQPPTPLGAGRLLGLVGQTCYTVRERSHPVPSPAPAPAPGERRRPRQDEARSIPKWAATACGMANTIEKHQPTPAVDVDGQRDKDDHQ